MSNYLQKLISIPVSNVTRRIILLCGGIFFVLATVLYLLNGTSVWGTFHFVFVASICIAWGVEARGLSPKWLWILLAASGILSILPIASRPLLAIVVLFLMLSLQFYSLRLILEPRPSWPLFKQSVQPEWLLPFVVIGAPFLVYHHTILHLIAVIVILTLFVRGDATDRTKGLIKLILTIFIYSITFSILISNISDNSIYRELFLPKYFSEALEFNRLLLLCGSMLAIIRLVGTPIIRNIRENSPIRSKLVISFLFTSLLPTVLLIFIMSLVGFVWLSGFSSRVANSLVLEPTKDMILKLSNMPLEDLKQIEDNSVAVQRVSNAENYVMRYHWQKVVTKSKQTFYRYSPVADSNKLFKHFLTKEILSPPYSSLGLAMNRMMWLVFVEREGSLYCMAHPITQRDLLHSKSIADVDIQVTSIPQQNPDAIVFNTNNPLPVSPKKEDEKDVLLSTVGRDSTNGFLAQSFPIGFIPYQTIVFDQHAITWSTLVTLYSSIDRIYITFSGRENPVLRFITILQLGLSTILFVIGLVAINIGFQITRLISSSADRLITGTLALRRGELGHRIPIESKDELGEIAYSFNLMAEDIKQMLAEIQIKERIKADLQIARSIQKNLMPNSPPVLPGWELSARNEFAEDVGGDFYDFQPLSENRIVISLGDVSGKGMAAALLMSNVQATLRTLCSMFDNPEIVVTKLNEAVYRTTSSELFVTLFLAVLDCETGVLKYVNAGHENPLLLSHGKIQELREGGAVVGAFTGMKYSNGEVKLDYGDRLLIYSDGISEATADSINFYGHDRLQSTLLASREQTAQEALDQLFIDVTSVTANAPPSDDRTVIFIHRFLNQ